MIGIIVQLAISWLIIWLFEKGNLSVLGFKPTKARLIQFLVFLMVTAACCASGFLLRMYFGRESWEVNPLLSYKLVLEGIWWNIKSVMFEELIFRGVLLYILIKKIGSAWAVVISAIAFGIYHWFSFGVYGDPRMMLITFLMTGTMGLLYAYGYASSFSLYIPIAIHLGWNFTKGFVFSEGPIGNGILVENLPPPQVQVSYFIYYLVTWFPMVSSLVINFLLIRKMRKTSPFVKNALSA